MGREVSKGPVRLRWTEYTNAIGDLLANCGQLQINAAALSTDTSRFVIGSADGRSKHCD
jgi:hypothetical protein